MPARRNNKFVPNNHREHRSKRGRRPDYQTARKFNLQKRFRMEEMKDIETKEEMVYHSYEVKEE